MLALQARGLLKLPVLLDALERHDWHQAAPLLLLLLLLLRLARVQWLHGTCSIARPCRDTLHRSTLLAQPCLGLRRNCGLANRACKQAAPALGSYPISLSLLLCQLTPLGKQLRRAGGTHNLTRKEAAPSCTCAMAGRAWQ